MKRLAILLAGVLLVFSAQAAGAHGSRVWHVTSPDHEQTFTYGSEAHRAWSSSQHGKPPHLVLYLSYTNDPYVTEDYPPMRDDFSFNFPNVKLQPDGRTFSYVAPDGHAIPVALRSPGFLGFEEIRLLPTSKLLIAKPHGYLTVTLQIVE